MINIITSSRYKVGRSKLKEIAAKELESCGVAANSILNIVFVGKNKMRKLAEKYKHEDVALPVLTFTYNEKTEDGILLGDVVICYPQAVLLAAERNKKVENIIIELIKHGVDNVLS